MPAAGDNDLSKPADPESANPQGETRPRKRRRRTVACTQCRSRKLKCDREYPSCGRCLKSRVPERCTYEDSFVWQQPNTVAAGTASSPGGIDHFNGNHITLPPPTRVAASPGFAAAGAAGTGGILPAYPKSASLQPSPQSLSSSRIHNITAPDLRQAASSRPRFLDTVLDAPNPPVNSEWPRIPDGNPSQRGHDAGNYEHALASPSQRLEIPNKVLIRGKETRTRFNGGGIVSNLMLQFPELGPFLHEVKANNPNFSRIRLAKDALKLGGLKHKLKEPAVTPTTATLLSLLPPKPVVDTLLRLYILYVESMHRVIHIPSFRRELAELHAHYGNPDMISAAFVVQLLLMLAAAVGFYDAEPTLEFADIKSSQVVDWITHAEKWFESSYIKRPDLTVLRIQCLLIIAKNNQGLKRSHAWLASGNLVKMAMLAGYHRDPGNIPKISIFSREMRRRMWTTIVELDAQIAIDRGMPPTLQASDYDTAPPLNINDDEIHESTTEEPQSRPVQEVTDCTFQTILTQSLSLRLKICKLMNSPVISCSYEDILRLEWELGRFQAIPVWPTTADREISHKLTLWTAVLETKLGQSLLAVHTPFAIEANEDPLFEPSSRSRLEVATVILSRHFKLHETSPRLSFGHPADTVCQAALSVLQHLFAKRSGYTSNLLRQVLPVITESLLELVERTIATMESRLLLIIKGAKQFFFLYMIFALVKAELHPDQAEEIKSVILDRICTVTYRILRSVDGMPNDGLDLPSLSQVPSLTSGNDNTNNHNTTPLDSVPGSFDSNNLSDLMLTPPDDFNSLLQVLDWEDFASFPISM